MTAQYVIGIDSGGSKTRALAADLDGVPVGYGEAGGGHPHHNPLYAEALKQAILGASSGVGIENIVCLVTGIAGLDDPSDTRWVEVATEISGLEAERIHVNDSEVAHFGAFSGSHGIVSIQGHGSNVFGITENGTRIRNANYLQYASGGAVALGMKFHFALLSGARHLQEERLLDRLCSHWNVDSFGALVELGRRGWDLSPDKARNHMGAFAPVVTSAALEGSELAREVCLQAAGSVAEGIGLVGQGFSSSTVPVVLIGSSVNSPAMSSMVAECLSRNVVKEYRIQKAISPPLVGAVLMALRQQCLDLTGVDKERLARFSQQ